MLCFVLLCSVFFCFGSTFPSSYSLSNSFVFPFEFLRIPSHLRTRFASLRFERSVQKNIENWVRCRVLRAHNLDVVDLAWCPPHNDFLATCSLDRLSPVCVWKLDLVGAGLPDPSQMQQTNAMHSGFFSSNPSPNPKRPQMIMSSPVATLGLNDVHKSFVKGCCFDPSGRHLVTSSDDPSICLWSATDNWSLVAKIDSSHPLKIFSSIGDGHSELISQCLFRRIDWSSDGSVLASTNGTLKNKPVVTLIERNSTGLKIDTDNKELINLVGHKDAVCSSRFNPLLFRAATNSGSGKKKKNSYLDSHRTVVALGDRKGFLTVWATGVPKPIFKSQISPGKSMITDISWGGGVTAGRTLFVSTLDGNVAAIEFTEEELGTALGRKERNEVLRGKYGDEVWEGVVKQTSNLSGSSSVYTSNPLDVAESSFQVGLEGDNSSSQTSQTTNGFSRPTPAPQIPAQTIASPTKTPAETRKAQVVTKTKKGKKRIAPVLVKVSSGDAGIDVMREEVGDDEMMIDNEQANLSPSKQTSNSSAEANLASQSTANNPSLGGLKADIVRAATNTIVPRPKKMKIADSTKKTVATQPLPSSATSAISTSRSPSIADNSYNETASRGNELLSPPQNDTLKCQLPLIDDENSSADGERTVVAAAAQNFQTLPATHNSLQRLSPQSSITITSQANRFVWRDAITGTVSAIAGNSSHLVVGTVQGELHIWKRFGPDISSQARKASPPAVLGGGGVCALSCNSDGNLLAVVGDGSFFVWNLKRLTLLFKGSLAGPMRSMTKSPKGKWLSKGVWRSIAYHSTFLNV